MPCKRVSTRRESISLPSFGCLSSQAGRATPLDDKEKAQNTTSRPVTVRMPFSNGRVRRETWPVPSECKAMHRQFECTTTPQVLTHLDSSRHKRLFVLVRVMATTRTPDSSTRHRRMPHPSCPVPLTRRQPHALPRHEAVIPISGRSDPD